MLWWFIKRGRPRRWFPLLLVAPDHRSEAVVGENTFIHRRVRAALAFDTAHDWRVYTFCDDSGWCAFLGEYADAEAEIRRRGGERWPGPVVR